jgi:phage terminase large subunit-like protein
MKNRYFIHPKAYWKVINFIEQLCHYREGDLAGEKIKVHTWFKWQLRTIYGRYDSVTHRRAIREAYIEIPKKNAKSMYISALGLYHSTSDGYYDENDHWVKEAAPQVFCAATTIQQARIIHDLSKFMVNKEPLLLKRLKPMQYSIVGRTNNAVFRVLSSDAEGQEGLNASAVLVDELHAHKDGGALYSSLKGAGASRPQPLTIIITTSGVHNPLSIGYRRHEYAEKVQQDWILDPSFHGKIYAAPQNLTDEQCLEEKYWKDCNPSLGAGVSLEYLRSRARECKLDPSMLNTFKRYHLNIWVSSHEQWIPKGLYQKCKSKSDFEENIGKRTWIGVDIGATEDLTAVARLWHTGTVKREDHEGNLRDMDTFAAKIDHFCTSNKIDAVQNNSQFITYQQWVNKGFIEIAGDTDTDYIRIRERIEEHIGAYLVRNITFDRFGAWEMATALEQRYRSKGPTFLRPISWNSLTASPPMKKLQALVQGGLIDLSDDPVLEWQFDNVLIHIDAKGNIFPNKAKAKGKIDGVVALILAVDGYLNDLHKDANKIMEFNVLNF